jgi:hypothetical protein
VLGLHVDSLSYRLIARNLGLSKNTVMAIVKWVLRSDCSEQRRNHDLRELVPPLWLLMVRCTYLRQREHSMSKGLSAEQEAALAKFQQSSRQMEATAVEQVDAGRALFNDREHADPNLQRRYRLYRRVEAALALPAGPERLAALHSRARLLERMCWGERRL